jgi:hypothetical protein
LSGEETLIAFHDVPAEHGKHIRTANPIESPFASVRLTRPRAASRATPPSMLFRLAQSAERHWPRLDGSECLAQIIKAARFRDGTLVQDAEKNVVP